MKCAPFVIATSVTALLAGAVVAGPNAMTPKEARHLISRTGFGASPQEIKALTGMSYEEGVAAILGTVATAPSTPMPAWVNAPDYPAEYIWALGQTASDLFFANRWMEIEELSGWWMSEMVATPSPLTERLTLFWHDHFATSYDSVENPQWMGRQNQFFRMHAAGNFADLAHGILQDPAMLVYLSNTENFADSPNENLGREFLELFTLGEGRGYTQSDVEAAARALTGHTIAELSAPVYTFYPDDHDSGVKTLLGQTGRFGAADLADLALAHPEFGPYIVEKLWKTFISDQPDAAEVNRLSGIWHENDLEMEPLLREMFLAKAFWAPENRGRLVKSPVELIVSTLRSLGTPVDNATGLAWLAHDMGQALFFPPNVGGWPEGVAWVNDASATSRATTLGYFAFGALAEDTTASAAMMNAVGGLSIPVTANPADLRVGQVFAIDGEKSDAVLGGLFVLYDVSFTGQTWRSIPIWVEANREEDYAGYAILKTDCRPDCFANLTGEEDEDWIWYGVWEGVLEEDLADATDQDIAFLQAIAAHLPALIKSTEDQASWQSERAEPVPKIAEMVGMAQDLARDSVEAIGPTQSKLVQGLRAPGLLGLQGATEVGDLDDIDSYVEDAEQARIRPAIPPVTYATGRDWLNDLPAGGLDSKRAAAALLAVPRQTLGQREELMAEDVEALVRALILSPEYQVN